MSDLVALPGARSTSTPPTIVDLLRERARRQPDTLVYRVLSDGENEGARLTAGALDARARSLAAWLRQDRVAGERVLLLIPPGLSYIEALFGTLYAGGVAVPAYPPRPHRSLSRLRSLLLEAQPAVVLTTASILGTVERHLGDGTGLHGPRWLTLERLGAELDGPADAWRPPEISGESLALLQYTSGSTAEPRGVMLTHANLLHNLAAIRDSIGVTSASRSVCWLPPYHDMGLIGVILQTLHAGCSTVLMPPAAFLQRPLRWLEAIAREGATINGGPPFAYDLCVRATTPEQRASLDLTCWEVAFVGAEPVRAETLDRFASAFAPSGFRRQAFRPVYGLAEATLLVSSGRAASPPMVGAFDRASLERERIARPPRASERACALVGCGRPPNDHQVVVVDPVTRAALPPGRVGEIWVAGPSVARGYWARPSETAATFGAARADSGAGPYLRTGDLGFALDDELFVTGRLKDLIIIRGRNCDPHDIERAVERSHPAARPASAAAFAVEAGGEEQLVVAQEVERHSRDQDLAPVCAAIRRAVMDELDLAVSTIVLLKPGGMPKTTSGKVRRRACRSLYEAGELAPLWVSGPARPRDATGEGIRDEAGALPSPPHPLNEPPLVLADLRARVSRLLGLEPEQVDPARPLDLVGLDSLWAADLALQIEAAYHVDIDVARLVQDLTLTELAAFVAAGGAGRDASRRCDAFTGPDAPQVAAPERLGPDPASGRRAPAAAQARMQFSLLYFASDAAALTGDRYALLLETARFADRHGFTALWVPERHFHPFGGLYPSPSVLAAALAMATSRIRLRAGSVVLPLHNPIRVAEEWSVVDNLSGGRVDLAFATGWNPNDFALAPGSYADRVDLLFAGLQTVHRLWRGEAIVVPNGVGQPTEIRVFPPPMQRTVNTWITCTGSVERFEQAGARGANVLTALLFQTVEELAEKIARYRAARARHGHNPEGGQVTLMLHTFVGDDVEAVRERVREPFTAYLESSVDLWQHGSRNLAGLPDRARAAVLAFAFERYFQKSALFGTSETCAAMVERVRAIGVDEIACLIDFGVDGGATMASLRHLNELRGRWAGAEPAATSPAGLPGGAVDDGGPRLDLKRLGRRIRPLGAALDLVYRCAATRTIVLGRDHLGGLPRRVVFAGTHRSYLDQFAVRAALASTTARAHLAGLLIVGGEVGFGDAVGRWAPWVAAALGIFLIPQRGAPLACLRGLIREAGADRSVLITPQGRHSDSARERAGDREVAFRTGVALLAAALDAPVVPYGIAGTEALVAPSVPPGFRGFAFADIPLRVGRGPVALAFGAPVRPEPGEGPRALTARIQSACLSLSQAAETALTAAPPDPPPAARRSSPPGRPGPAATCSPARDAPSHHS